VEVIGVKGSRSVLLIEVTAPHLEALRDEARRRQLGIECAGDEDPISSDCCLCVVELRVSDERARRRLKQILKLQSRVPVVVLAHGAGVDDAVALMRLGVSDVISLPAPAHGAAGRALDNAGGADASAAGELVGENRAIQQLRGEIRNAARVDSTVLLQGETGTGKGLVARLIHEQSRRRRGAFVHVDCAALSPGLIESELFGHEKGAFTGAGAQRRGRFELANDGTIFLDEIGDLDAHLQTKLLRVLEDRRYERVGGSRTLIMQARVIAATSHDLLERVRRGTFRKDLYFRLNVVQLRIPPLRDRKDDLGQLVESGLDRLADKLGVPRPRVSPGFLGRLGDYDWPGNVRELMNVLERVLVNYQVDVLEPEDLPGLTGAWRDGLARAECETAELPEPVPFADLPIAEEEKLLRTVLTETGGNVARASRRLRIPRGTLRYRIEKFSLQHMIPKD
jgi:DNA-binding NtrC family response regulator